MQITIPELQIMNLVLQVDSEGKAKQYALAELSTANDIFKEIKKRVEDDRFTEGEIELSSEQKVFLMKCIDERSWALGDAETVFALKALLK